ncbi:MAG: tetratricopeptide repeat-containing protein, partial [Deltaproteobacteria bacterium]
MGKRLCFVVMGYGKKTDYSSGTPRTLDLDATFEAIIKPAVDANDLECVRSDKIAQSGIIDVKMYEMLLRADLVIADISTENANALYELGVRHALRPWSTIIMKEADGKFLFDLNHLATLQYKHLGADIGSREAKDKVDALSKLIAAVLAKPQPDSPVYTYLTGLRQPSMSDAEFKEALRGVKEQTDTLSAELVAARTAAQQSRHAEARDRFRRAWQLQTGPDAQGKPFQPDPYVVQQLALHTYKAGEPDALSALRQAWSTLEVLNPLASTDPETLGIGGAIQKRLWERTKDRTHLDLAIDLYGRGFELKRDYYNGENYAVCLDLRAALQTDPQERDYDARTARKVRERTVDGLRQALQDPACADRSDYKWMLATMANSLYALGGDGNEFEQRFRRLDP